MNKIMKIIARKYSISDKNAIFKLFEIVFNKKIDNSFWKWRFEQNPFGCHVSKLIKKDNEIIAQYLVFRLQYRLKISCLS